MKQPYYDRNAFSGAPLKPVVPQVPQTVAMNLEDDRNRLREALAKIRKIADGRRHYEGEECFDALGLIREICNKAMS